MRLQKVILASVMAVAAGSALDAIGATQTICSAPPSSTLGNSPAVGSFIVVAFNVHCSANVYLVGDDRTTNYGAGAASAKGRTSYGGSTASGVTASSLCAAATCSSTDAQTTAISAPSS